MPGTSVRSSPSQRGVVPGVCTRTGPPLSHRHTVRGVHMRTRPSLSYCPMYVTTTIPPFQPRVRSPSPRCSRCMNVRDLFVTYLRRPFTHDQPRVDVFEKLLIHPRESFPRYLHRRPFLDQPVGSDVTFTHTGAPSDSLRLSVSPRV